MSSTRDAVVTIVGAVVAVVLQVVLAPNIALFGAQPNFLLVYALSMAIARPNAAGAVLPFVLGLLYDLLGTGPVGGMAFLLVLVCFLASLVFSVLDNRTALIAIIGLVAGVLLVETLYGILLVTLGMPVGVGEMFLYRALPCSLYDCVVVLIVYPIVSHLFKGEEQTREPFVPRVE